MKKTNNKEFLSFLYICFLNILCLDMLLLGAKYASSKLQ